jgi:pyruvate formate lyase activating enzyme
MMSTLPEEQVLAELAERAAFIDGVVITGGEPTLQRDLLSFIKKACALKLKIKLDTNGYRPEIIKKLLEENLLDYIAMDIKGPLSRYEEITGVPINTKKIKQSIALIMNSGIDYEFRTTVWRTGFTQQDFLTMLTTISGARHYYLQNMFPAFTLPTKQQFEPMRRYEIEPILELAAQHVQHCALRGEWL